MITVRIIFVPIEWIVGRESAGLGVVESCSQIIIPQVEVVGFAGEEVG